MAERESRLVRCACCQSGRKTLLKRDVDWEQAAGELDMVIMRNGIMLCWAKGVDA